MSHRTPINIKDWLKDQSKEFQEVVGNFDQFIKKPLDLETLKKLDDKFINNSPEGGE